MANTEDAPTGFRGEDEPIHDRGVPPDELVIGGGSFVLTPPYAPGVATGWVTEGIRDPEAKEDDYRWSVIRPNPDGPDQVAAEGMRSKPLADALAAFLNNELTLVLPHQAAQLRAQDEALTVDEPQPDAVAVAIHDLADAVRETRIPLD